MKKAFTILAIIASVFSIIIAVLPISNLAIFPTIAALIFGIIAFYFSKKAGEIKKIIQFTFILTFIALAITTYKAFFTKTEVSKTEVLDAKEIQLEEEAIQELEDIEIDDEDLNKIESDRKDYKIE